MIRKTWFSNAYFAVGRLTNTKNIYSCCKFIGHQRLSIIYGCGSSSSNRFSNYDHLANI